MTIRILIADDHQMVRLGLRAMLETEPQCLVAGEAGTGEEAVALVRSLRPDVLITDMVMPGIGGLEVIRQARLAAPALAVVVYSMHAEERYVREALRAGATAYVLKESPADELRAAVRHAAAGQRFLSAALSQRAIDAYARPDDRPFDPYDTLTEREREVLGPIVEGRLNKQVGAALGVSEQTVKVHRHNIMRKMAAASLPDLVRMIETLRAAPD